MVSLLPQALSSPAFSTGKGPGGPWGSWRPEGALAGTAALQDYQRPQENNDSNPGAWGGASPLPGVSNQHSYQGSSDVGDTWSQYKDDDWMCKSCRFVNFRRNYYCKKCEVVARPGSSWAKGGPPGVDAPEGTWLGELRASRGKGA